MKRLLWLCPLAFLLILSAESARASSAIVPDAYPTIVAAIASGADSVLVGEGTYPESLLINRPLVLIPKPVAVDAPTPFPEVGSIAFVAGSGYKTVIVRGFNIQGYVRQVTNCLGQSMTVIEGCRVAQGVTANGGCTYMTLRLHGCVIYGRVDIRADYNEMIACSVFDGGINQRAHGWLYLKGSHVDGAPGTGIATCCFDGAPEVEHNVVTGTVDGIAFQGGGTFAHNTVRDISGSGFRSTSIVSGSEGAAKLSDNQVLRAGGHGIDFDGTRENRVTLERNHISNVGLTGIHSRSLSSALVLAATGNEIEVTGSHGINLETGGTLTDNRVLRAGGAGIVLGVGSGAARNVVGRSTAQGFLDPSNATSASFFQNNTSYLNGQAGYEINGGVADTLVNNIAFANSGYGLAWSGAVPIEMGCNDWYANIAGATSGLAPAATDLAVDPLFCNVPGDAVSLSSTSPLLNAAGCGLIGALGLGCNAVAAAPATTADRPTFMVSPAPARGAVAFAWTPTRQPVRVEVFDVHGARRWEGTATPGARSLTWSGADSRGASLPAGVYFARGTIEGVVYQTRVVLAR